MKCPSVGSLCAGWTDLRWACERGGADGAVSDDVVDGAASTWRVEEGDCIDVLRGLPDASIDAVVTDPPYGIGFMGKAWDTFDPSTLEQRVGSRDGNGPPSDVRDGRAKGRTASAFANPAGEAGAYDLSLTANRRFQAWCEAWASEALRVLKPGGHLIAFGGTRSYHRMAAGVEDAGFEIRDTIAWMFGSGFPKSLDVSKAIDKAAGADREIVGRSERHIAKGEAAASSVYAQDEWTRENGRMGEFVTAPATPEAEQWAGWGTALKPGFEPIVVARKPLAGTVATNVLAHGTGCLNIDGCRVAAAHDAGRWPANVVLDEAAGSMLDAQAGELTSGANPTQRTSDKSRQAYGDFKGQRECISARGADVGGASRFFYCAKASSGERNAGLSALSTSDAKRTSSPESTFHNGRAGSKRVDDREYVAVPRTNVHPTVKPITLMRWLVRLVTPPGGAVLDLFAGSGTTGIAAVLEGLHFVGVEREFSYASIARARIAHWERTPWIPVPAVAAQAGQVTLDELLDVERNGTSAT